MKRACSRNSMHSMSWRDLGLIAQAEVFVECRREPLPTIAKHLQEHFRGVGLEADLAAAGFSPTVLTRARCAGCGHDFLVACSCVRAPGLTSAKLPVNSRRLRSGPVPAWRLQIACLFNRQSRRLRRTNSGEPRLVTMDVRNRTRAPTHQCSNLSMLMKDSVPR